MSKAGVGIIVLAAGTSSRMGEPKQLLVFEGATLLGRAVRTALETDCRPVVVVLGSQADVLRKEVVATDAQIVVNQLWQEGLGSSIRCGLRALEKAAPVSAVLLTLCDQPFVTGAVLMRLVHAYRTKQAPLVASEYTAGGEKTLGVPALFSLALFPELMALRETEGAKRIIMRHAAETEIIEVPEAARDVDTPDDYRALNDE